MRMIAMILALASMPTFASAFGSNDPRLTVNPISSTQFEVVLRRGAWTRDAWCAAARYTQRNLGQQRGDLWIAKPVGPSSTFPGRKGVVFSTQPVGTTVKGVSVSISQVGYSLPVGHAQQFCLDYSIDRDNR